MPSVTLSDVSWATPDGRTLISNLDLTFSAERTGLVGRNGVGKSTLLRLIAGTLTPSHGNLSVTGTVGVLSQTVQVAADHTLSDLFGASDALAILRRAEAGVATEADLAEADWTLEARITAALAAVGLDAAPDTPLANLSGGQRTRAGLAALVFSDADILLLDEPTNNLDQTGRQAVIDLLAGWRKGAIVVSHDRDLLERMDAIVELTTLGATRYAGGWSVYRERRALDLAAARRDLADAEKQLADVRREAQAAAERQAQRNRAGRKTASRGDLPRILLGMRKDRAEDTGGSNARLAERRRTEAEAEAASARTRIEVLQPLTMDLPPTHLPSNRTVLRLTEVTAGYDRERPIIRDLSFTLTGPERVAVVGPNGAGKTTLLALITGQLAPWQGTVDVLTDMAWLDQRVSLLDPAPSIRDNFRRLHPGTDENACRAALARFMFRADAALQIVGDLSGGQMLRAGLACALGGAAPPPLLILDEPTNHLDIDAIAAVEAGLRAYDGALVIISHDPAFLEAVGLTRELALIPQVP